MSRPRRIVTTAVMTAAYVIGSPFAASAQSLLQRPPNITSGWVGTPGALQLDASVRYRSLGDAEFVPLPTILVGYGFVSNLFLGVTFATFSPVVPGQTSELEPFLRWAPIVERASLPLQLATQLAFNTASVSLDGEIEAGYRVGLARFLAAARFFTNAYSGEGGFALAGGLTLQPWRGRVPLALAGDVGVLGGIDRGDNVIWSTGIQIGLPVTPTTLSLQVTNATSGTIEGRSLGVGRTRFGVELTVASPIGEILGVFVPRDVAARAVQPIKPPAGRIVRIDIREFAFVGDRIVVPAGTTIEWTNRDKVVHTATSDDGAWNSGAIQPGGTWTARFDVPGIYSYHCSPHPYMRGSIIVH